MQFVDFSGAHFLCLYSLARCCNPLIIKVSSGCIDIYAFLSDSYNTWPVSKPCQSVSMDIFTIVKIPQSGINTEFVLHFLYQKEVLDDRFLSVIN